MSVMIRPAVEADQSAIECVLRSGGLSRRVQWPGFVVAEDQGQLIGVGQVRPLRGGSRELARVAVVRERRGEGIASSIIRALIAHESGPLYGICLLEMSSYYEQFGFTIATLHELPAALAMSYVLSRVAAAIVSAVSSRRFRVVAMRREPQVPRA
ncbi:MAG TPA: GNAT family N-acetyltransferase [Anaerolineae bacterium]|nr:GNAT family N-acetyltransferase [Anaerolineae bacterium]